MDHLYLRFQKDSKIGNALAHSDSVINLINAHPLPLTAIAMGVKAPFSLVLFARRPIFFSLPFNAHF